MSLRKILAAMVLLGAGAAQAADAPFLWEVSGARNKHYLMGSVHMLPESAYPLPPALDTAYAAADALVLETDIAALTSPQLQAQMLSAGASPSGLKNEIGAPLYQRVQDYAHAHGIPGQLCDAFKAWFCSLTLEVLSFQQTGSRPDLGLDQHYYMQALAARKAVLWLE
ncbi:MAG TPA: TraB/GumN family protein, partial [Nevskiaceae bacterium]|nr:TraB/GumN family protein [Nevskiaceae bacterium]